MDLVALNSELTNDPENLGYAAYVNAADDIALANLLNARNRAGRRIINCWEVKLHAIQNNYWPVIKIAAETASDATAKAAAQTTLDYINDLRFTAFDIDSVTSQTLLTVLVMAGIMTSDQKDSLSALADTQISRAEELGLVAQGINVTPEQAGAAR